ncbi:MAG TPA: C-terminal binding protein [Pirellulales bacterium]|nr:C-terminal binding protein [Pirellulales bacterium]
MSKKILLTDYAWPDLDIERGALAAAGCELIVAPAKDPASLAKAAVDVAAIMTNWAKVTAEVIEAAPRLKIISRLGIGLDNIDVACATRRKIVVTNVPDYCLIEVAEHALALLLALSRKVAFYHWQTQGGAYDLSAGPVLARIEGQTLGIVGLGNIGRVLARKAQGLGLKVVATSRSARDVPPGVKLVELDELLKTSDYVSLHVPVVPETRHLIGERALGLMKPSAYLINTARGGLIDNAALARALAAGRLAGAGLDVQDPEPPDLTQAPWNDPRVIVTPHAAFMSRESLDNLRSRTARQVAMYLAGERPENVVNPSVL